MHAEIELISKIRYLDINFSEVEIYVYRETRDGRKALAKPCLACETALRELGIRRVYYTGNNSYISEVYEGGDIMPLLDLTGQKFNYLLVLERDNEYTKINNIKHGVYWKCQCECGKITSVRSDCLRKKYN